MIGKVKSLWVCRGKTCIQIHVPLHGRTNAKAVAQVNIVSHSNFIAIIQNGCSR